MPDTVRAAKSAIQRANAVLITFELPLPTIQEAITLASRCGARVFLQPAPPLADPRDNGHIPWEQVDVLVPNEAEAIAILEGVGDGREHQVDDLAMALATELAVPTVVVTLGESGCISHVLGESRQYAARHTVSIDSTGASDAFVSSLAAYMLGGASEAEAIEAGLAAAAWAVGHSGGHESMPESAQVIVELSRG